MSISWATVIAAACQIIVCGGEIGGDRRRDDGEDRAPEGGAIELGRRFLDMMAQALTELCCCAHRPDAFGIDGRAHRRRHVQRGVQLARSF